MARPYRITLHIELERDADDDSDAVAVAAQDCDAVVRHLKAFVNVPNAYVELVLPAERRAGGDRRKVGR